VAGVPSASTPSQPIRIETNQQPQLDDKATLTKVSISPLGSSSFSSTNTKMNKIFSTRGGATKIAPGMASGDSTKNLTDPNAKYNSPMAVLYKYGVELKESQELDDVRKMFLFCLSY
jgi:hypothetical protein